MSIDKFEGEFEFLSNFYYSPVEWEGKTYPTIEHAFQAAKSFDPKYRNKVSNVKSPSAAKALGRAVTLRPDWEDLKLDIMTILVTKKFSGDAKLAMKLLKTGNQELIEGNTWNDVIWGVCKGKGQNLLGKILMAVRQGLINHEPGYRDNEGE